MENNYTIEKESSSGLLTKLKTINIDSYASLKEKDPALYYAYKAVQVEPWTLGYREHLLNLLLKRKKYNDAFDVINDGLTEYPAWWNGYDFKGLIFKEIGDIEASIENFGIAMSNGPTMSICYHYIEAFIDAGLYENAMDVIENILKSNPANSNTHYYQAIILKKQNKIKEALQNARESYELNIKNTRHAELLIEILLITTQYTDALKIVSECIQYNSDWATGYYYLAFLLRKFLKTREASECAKKAWELDGGDTRYAALLITLYIETQKLPEAENIARKALFKNPDWSEGYYLLAQIFAAQENFAVALENANVALKKEVKNLQYRTCVVNILMRLGRPHDAVKAVRVGLALQPEWTNGRDFIASLSLSVK